ncbi:hypothetical protein QR680_012113 [Steinernema hermaphroditum]|uniref:F-box domain-containing protein n=1 Tax=Steinernema hermaphroditum TaxID=289476 RepID=A0AA39I3N0_9BILA|nr:hypothetical protein QR680_012113 [Steinernema hermaphroditum]
MDLLNVSFYEHLIQLLPLAAVKQLEQLNSEVSISRIASAFISSYRYVTLSIYFCEGRETYCLCQTRDSDTDEAEEVDVKPQLKIDQVVLFVARDNEVPPSALPYIIEKATKANMKNLIRRSTSSQCRLMVEENIPDGVLTDLPDYGIPLDRITEVEFHGFQHTKSSLHLFKELSMRNVKHVSEFLYKSRLNATFFQTVCRNCPNLRLSKEQPDYVDIKCIVASFMKLAEESPLVDWDLCVDYQLDTFEKRPTNLYILSAYFAQNDFGKTSLGGFVKKMGDLEVQVVALKGPYDEWGNLLVGPQQHGSFDDRAKVEKVTLKNIRYGGGFEGVLMKGKPCIPVANCYPSDL